MSLFTGAAALAGYIATAAGATVAAKLTSGGNTKAAGITAAATTHGADLQQQSNDAALAYQRQQAEAAYQSSEATRHANYDQWATGQRRLGSVGDLVGLPAREIPAYVAGPDPNFTGGAPSASAASGAPPAAAGGMPTLGASFDPQAAAAAWNSAYPGRPFDAAYWGGKWPELVARGQQLNDPTYATKRLMGYGAGGADVALAGPFAGGAGAPATAGRGTPYASVGDYLTPNAPIPITPSLMMPTPNRYGAVGSYL